VDSLLKSIGAKKMATIQSSGDLLASIAADLSDNNAGLISAEDVRHNHERLIAIANENLKNLENICKKYNISPSRVDEICTTFDIMGNE
jgi:cob(I)alamin adenosyltransferase